MSEVFVKNKSHETKRIISLWTKLFKAINMEANDPKVVKG